MTSAELKRLLVREGFQVFRTLGSEVVLADRVRDNLVMDSGVRVVCGDALALRITFRVQASEYPQEGEEELLARARALMARDPLPDYEEVEAAVVPLPDPNDSARVLDTSCEVTFERRGVEPDAIAPEVRLLLARWRLA